MLEKDNTKHILQDEKGYVAQINCDKALGGMHVLAGEDGLISVNGELLEKMTNAQGFLTHIEDVCIMKNGDLVVVCVDGDIGQYVYNQNNQKDNAYKLKKLISPTDDDCLYYIDAYIDANINNRSVTVWGERNIKYIVLLQI